MVLVHRIYITNSGCGYTVAPWISLETIKGETGVGAAATAGITTLGSIQTVSIANSGSGYITNPSVLVCSNRRGWCPNSYGIGIINSGEVMSLVLL